METNSSKKIKVVFNDDFTLCGDFDTIMEYNVSFYVKELNTEQLKYLYEKGVTVRQSRLAWMVYYYWEKPNKGG